MADLIILPPAAKYLKKLKDKPLKKLYAEAIKEICNLSSREFIPRLRYKFTGA